MPSPEYWLCICCGQINEGADSTCARGTCQLKRSLHGVALNMDRSRRGTDRAGAASAGPPPPRGGVGKQQPRRVRPQTSRPREASAAQQNAVLAPRRPAPLKL
eukprot:7385571-Prymnesium_polylepis.1